MRSLYVLSLLAGLVACRGTDSTPAPPVWETISYGAPQLTSFSEVKFASSQVGWITGGYTPDQTYSATLLTTRDGGSTWARVPMLPFTLNGFITLSPVTERLVFGVGVSPNPTGTPGADNRAVYKSTDGGSTWQQLQGAGFGGSFKLHFFDEQTGLSFKNNLIQKTTDGGASWQTVFKPMAGNWDRVQFPTPTVGYAAGGGVSRGIAGGIFSSGSLAKTTDQGATWQALPWDKQYINSLSFVSAAVGFAATYPDQHLYKTQDGGTSWQLVNEALPGSSGQFINEREGFFSNDTKLYYTRDGGNTWQQAYQVAPLNKYPASINSINFPDPTVGFAVTADGQILKSTR
jgi:photosystem II stability/assembly factor-like uncharacterized protein